MGRKGGFSRTGRFRTGRPCTLDASRVVAASRAVRPICVVGAPSFPNWLGFGCLRGKMESYPRFSLMWHNKKVL